ncbi:MAG: gamma-glutamyltransferase [Bacteroidota bacterium]
MNKILLLLITLTIFACVPTTEKDHGPKIGLIADSAMVVSAHPLASEVGVNIMRQGGNAIDAAIATQFALAVVHPTAGNLGGGGFVVLRTQSGQCNTLDFREKAPASSSETMYQDSTGNVIENLSTRGHLAAGVPGSVAGMVEAHKKHGTLPWEDLLQPAVDLALQGFTLTEKEANGLNRNQENFITYNTETPEFLINDWKEGDSITFTDLGHTLERIRDLGRSGFYEGETARLIVEEMQRGNGLISLDDLKDYEAVWREPIIGKYKDFKMISMAPPSSGGVALMQLLTSVEGRPLSAHNSAQTIHLMTEAERRVYADRATHLGDADYYNVPVQELLDSVYIAGRMQNFSTDQATNSDSIAAGVFDISESEQTTHFSIVDPFGNAVAVTTTLNGGYGSKVVVAGAGFLLNNEMDDFSIKPGVPNYYGLIGGKANAIEPGKRMLSSMTPTIVEKDNQLFMVVGTPGGSTIITSVFQTILNVIEHNMPMQEAVNAGRVHHQWKPDRIGFEDGAISTEDSSALVAIGHTLRNRGKIGRVDAILVLPDGKLEGGADPRGDDSAIGY